MADIAIYQPDNQFDSHWRWHQVVLLYCHINGKFGLVDAPSDLPSP